MVDKKYLEEKLKENSYKLTSQRKAILESLLENQGHFLTADEIFIRTKEKYPQTNFSTIYRNLEMLEKIDVIHKTNIKNGAAAYELVCSHNHHHHIICKKCGKTETIDFCPLEELNEKFHDKNFTLTDHKFELYGYCDNCHKDK